MHRSIFFSFWLFKRALFPACSECVPAVVFVGRLSVVRLGILRVRVDYPMRLSLNNSTFFLNDMYCLIACFRIPLHSI